MYADGNGYWKMVLPRMGLKERSNSEWGAGQWASFFCLENTDDTTSTLADRCDPLLLVAGVVDISDASNDQQNRSFAGFYRCWWT
jgi:hypothetical protein